MTRRASATRPLALGPGARVALVAPAGPLDPERVEKSAARCRSLGLEPVVFPGARNRYRYFAGTDAQRLGDLQAAFDDRTIDGIWALRGGYGSQRILDRLDLARQKEAPIPFIGFSDNTALHARHASLRVISFHGPHSGVHFPKETEDSFRRVLFAPEPAGVLPSLEGDPRPQTLVSGRAEAPLVGGNLALLASLCGTRDAVKARGCILFLEDIGEPAYRLDRMLLQLERAGALAGVAGLAFGRFTDVPNEDEQPAGDVLSELAERIGRPAVMDLPFGHVRHNCTLPVGGRALLDADTATLSLTEAAVRSAY